MASSFLIPTISSYSYSSSHTFSLYLHPPRPYIGIRPPQPQALALRLSHDDRLRLTTKTRSPTTTVTRAGASTSSYVFAFVFPLSLLAITIFASIQIADKLDRDFLEELAVNEALREAYDSGEDVEGDPASAVIDEEPRTRNRPKRQAQTSSLDQ